MDYATYKLLHQIGVALLLLGLGSALVTARVQVGRRLPLFLHGIGLVLVLVAGFGLQAKLGLGFPGWLLAKIGIWVVLASLPALVRRGALNIAVALIVAALLAGAAVYLVLRKPF